MSERIFIRERRATKPCAERLSSPKGASIQKRAELELLNSLYLKHRQRELPEVPLSPCHSGFTPYFPFGRLLVDYINLL